MENIRIAHINQKTGKTQSLKDHLNNVAALAGSFAEDFGNADWAKLCGFWHDLGKFLCAFLNYILGKQKRTINHSTAGAVWAYHRFGINPPAAKIIPYIIAGHHAGLPDWDHDDAGGDLISRLYGGTDGKILNTSEIDEIQQNDEAKDFLSKSLPSSAPMNKTCHVKDPSLYTHLWIRMLYSCLVDADYLDTEQFMEPEKSLERGKYASLAELKKRLDVFMENKTKNAPFSGVNTIRAEVLSECKQKALLKPGFFSLQVPTGGGKTLASMEFALTHALEYGKKRVIVVIPYTSIIEQNARVYKWGTDNEKEIAEIKKNGNWLFGEENVIEHHSGFEYEDKDDEKHDNILKKQQLATENWDAPIIVTTNVQLFESIFASRSSSCRKLHNIVNSVIILDEAQMIPPEFLKSILAALQSLVECFGVTVVLCTATQPSLEGTIGSETAAFKGITSTVTPIIDEPDKIAEKLKRVDIDTTLAVEQIPDWQFLADKLISYQQVLCIVQTRKDCRELHSLMPKGTIHLSALMCPAERSAVITEIKEKLHNNDPVRVVSTGIVECGVNFDFPIVFRALAGFDSVAQAAGRCNREGRLQGKRGTVFLFNPPKKSPNGLLRKGVDATEDILHAHQYNISLTPALYHEYFTKYYASVNNFDKPEFTRTMIDNIRLCKFQFRTLAQKYHLIDDSYQKPVIVKYVDEETGENAMDILSLLENATAEEMKSLYRRLGKFSVNLPAREIECLEQEGRIIEMNNLYVQNDDGLYQQGVGLVADALPSFATYIF